MNSRVEGSYTICFASKREEIKKSRDAEDERKDFVNFFRDKILKKEADLALFDYSMIQKKLQKRKVPMLPGLTQKTLDN